MDSNIDCVKVGSKLVENDCDSTEEINAITKIRTDEYKSAFKKINYINNKQILKF